MKIKNFCIIIISILIAVGMQSCSNDDPNPEDYLSSPLSGDYKKDGLWKLHVTVNGNTPEDYGNVRFDSSDLVTGDFRFVNVIPGVSEKKFNNVPLTPTEDGMKFEIEYLTNDKTTTITGIVSLGEMTVVISN